MVNIVIDKKDQITNSIIHELYRAVEILGGDFLLLSAIGSWGDTLPDEDVLANLRGWNRGNSTTDKSRNDTSCHHQVYILDEDE